MIFAAVGTTTLVVLSLALTDGTFADRCEQYAKRDFTSTPSRTASVARDAAPATTLRTIGYGDHPDAAPPFEQLTLAFRTAPATGVPCVAVDEERGGTRLRIVIESANTTQAPELAPSLERVRRARHERSMFRDLSFETISPAAVAVVVDLQRGAPFRYFLFEDKSGERFFVIQVRSYRSSWTMMDPAVVRRVLTDTPVPRVEYRLPETLSDAETVDVPVRVTQRGAVREYKLVVPNLELRLHDEGYLLDSLRPSLRLLQQSVNPAPGPATTTTPATAAVPPVAGTVEEAPTDAVAAAEYGGVIRRGTAIEKRSGHEARLRYVFTTLEAFARQRPLPKYIPAYRAIEQSYLKAVADADETYLLRLFTNFAAAKLLALGEKDGRPRPELPRPGIWTAPGARRRPVAYGTNGGPQALFDDVFWSWRQSPTAVLYDLSSYRSTLATRGGSAPFTSDALQKEYGAKLYMEVAGTYTTREGSIVGLAIRDGNLVGFLPRPSEGLLLIKDGRVTILSVLDLTRAALGAGTDTRTLNIFESPEDFVAFLDLARTHRITVLQGHLLTLDGKYDASFNNTVRARRRVVLTASKPSLRLAVVDFAQQREMSLRETGEWLASAVPGATAFNLDMGGWDYGRVYDSGNRGISIAVQATSDKQLSNKLVFYK
jgi:hypothetical protein